MVKIMQAPQFGLSDFSSAALVAVKPGAGSVPDTAGRLTVQRLIDMTIASGAANVYPSWAVLEATVGDIGAVAFVPVDPGTHTDPVLEETVDNAGCYAWSDTPAGWTRFAATLDQSAAAAAADAAAIHVAAAEEILSQVEVTSGVATDAADDAAGSAGLAEALVGPAHPSRAIGEDLTPVGRWFAVDNGDGTQTAWRRTIDGSDSARTLATTALLGSNVGASIIKTSTNETLEKVAATARRGVDSSEIVAALAAAASGRKIILDRPYEIGSMVTMNLSAEVDVEMRPGAGFTKTGVTHDQRMILINANGKAIRMIGPDYSVPLIGNNKANAGIEINQLNGALSPEIEIRGFFVQGFKLVATGTNFSAMGIALFGRMRARLLGNRADGIGRAAGTGVPGNSGTFAFVVAEREGKVADSIEFSGNQWDNLYTEDAYGGSNCYDVDGAILKVGDNTGNPIRADRNRSGPNCMGRDLKFQGIGADVLVGRHDFARGIRAITGGTPIIDVQTERGIVTRVVGTFTGADVHLEPWTIVDISPRTANDPFPRHYGDMDIDDRSTGTNGLYAFCGNTPQPAAVAGGKSHAATMGLTKVKGKAARHIINAGNTGDMDHRLFLDGFDGSISLAAINVGSPCGGLRVYAGDLINRGSSVPAVRRTDGAGLGVTWGKHYRTGRLVGFHEHDGNHFAASSGSSLGPSFLDPTRGEYMPGNDSRAIVRRGPPPITLAFGTTALLGDGKFGYSGYGARLKIRVPGSTLYACDLLINGSTGVVSNATHSLFTWGGVLSAAPTSPSGQFIFWRSSVDSNYYVTATFASGTYIIDVQQE